MTNYDVMTKQIAAVIQWTKKILSIQRQSKSNFITGHSAGGHLCALAVMNLNMGQMQKHCWNYIERAAGLDMKLFRR
jgi:acetyl esterase/lipase